MGGLAAAVDAAVVTEVGDIEKRRVRLAAQQGRPQQPKQPIELMPREP